MTQLIVGNYNSMPQQVQENKDNIEALNNENMQQQQAIDNLDDKVNDLPSTAEFNGLKQLVDEIDATVTANTNSISNINDVNEQQNNEIQSLDDRVTTLEDSGALYMHKITCKSYATASYFDGKLSIFNNGNDEAITVKEGVIGGNPEIYFTIDIINNSSTPFDNFVKIKQYIDNKSVIVIPSGVWNNLDDNGTYYVVNGNLNFGYTTVLDGGHLLLINPSKNLYATIDLTTSLQYDGYSVQDNVYQL